MEVSGKVHLITDEQNVNESYKKRELVISTDEKYVQYINIEFGQDKCALLNNLSIGDEVKVSINLGGRSWTSPQGETKYFNSIKGWKVEKLQSESPQQTKQEPAMDNPFFPPASPFVQEEHLDMPF